MSIELFPPRLLSPLRIIPGAIVIYSPPPNPSAVRNTCGGHVDNSPLRSEFPAYPPPLRRRHRGDISTLANRGHLYFGLTEGKFNGKIRWLRLGSRSMLNLIHQYFQ